MIKQNFIPEEKYLVKFSIKYQTSPGQNIFILGNIPELGNWKDAKFKLKWSEGHFWKGKLELPMDTDFFQFKFVCFSDDNKFKRWEEGPDRIFDKRTIDEDKDRTYKVDCMWEHFSITFHIYYPVGNEVEHMQIIGGPQEIGGWFKNGSIPLKMSLTEPKTLQGIFGKFWHAKVFLKANQKENFDFEYRYSIYNPIKGSAIWEREPNRKLKILTDYNLVVDQDGYEEALSQTNREVELITNSHIERLDVNFVANLKFDRIGDYNVYIGPYPQNEDDIEKMASSGVTAVLNVQTDTDMTHRQINWQHNLASYEKHEIQVIRYPIRDFDQQDLISKLKGANDLLKELLMEGKTVYVHCTAGMSRAAATVIGYLVFYECYSLEDAYDFVKFHRSIICPNMGAIAEVIKNYS